MTVKTYSPAGQTLKAFHLDNSFVRAIMGPIGSGKSTACALEILRKAQQQQPSPDGVRRSRWAIIRNSYPELKTTTLNTWKDWCPASYGRLTMDSPIRHHIKTEQLDMEVLFLALDRPEDQKKLLSLELTGGWINEAREVPKAILDALTGRVGRYPARNMGGASWSGILLDTNPPDDQSWWYECAENETPEGWRFFRQPGGDSLDAENIENLPKNYYDRIRAGKDPDWIKVYVEGEYGFVTEGKPVYKMWRDSTHVSPTNMEPVQAFALILGLDFGLTPALTIGQCMPDGQWRVYDEVLADNTGVKRFGEQCTKYIAQKYPDFNVATVWADPSGGFGTDVNPDETAIKIFAEATGWEVKPAPTNDPMMRIEVVINALNRMIDGQPGFQLNPGCATLRKGFSGGYHYKAIKTANGEQFHDKPNKNKYSHPHDACQYMLLGGGEADVVMNRKKKSERRRGFTPAGMDFDPLAV